MKGAKYSRFSTRCTFVSLTLHCDGSCPRTLNKSVRLVVRVLVSSRRVRRTTDTFLLNCFFAFITYSFFSESVFEHD